MLLLPGRTLVVGDRSASSSNSQTAGTGVALSSWRAVDRRTSSVLRKLERGKEGLSVVKKTHVLFEFSALKFQWMGLKGSENSLGKFLAKYIS